MKENEISEKVYRYFFTSLLWIVVAITCASFFDSVANIIKIDFLHVNPYRTQSHAVWLPFMFTPFAFIIVLFGVAISFGSTQFAQAFLTTRLVQKYGIRGLYCILLSVPLMTIISWYCYDYLTPSNVNLGINCGPEWVPYEHGLTMKRYLIMLLLQAFITLFSLSRLFAALKGRFETTILLALLSIASILGFIRGFS